MSKTGPIIEQGARGLDQVLLRRHEPAAAPLGERLIDLGEIVRMRPGDDAGAELDRFDRVLPAMRHQRAANEGECGKAIEKAEFADRVTDIDPGPGAGRGALR